MQNIKTQTSNMPSKKEDSCRAKESTWLSMTTIFCDVGYLCDQLMWDQGQLGVIDVVVVMGEEHGL